MKMAHALEYIYDDGSKVCCIATIYHDGERIRFKLHASDLDNLCPSLRGKDIREHVLKLIMFPVQHQKLRTKALPYCFNSEIQPHSLDHFYQIPHNYGSFRFSPISECDDIPYQETIVA